MVRDGSSRRIIRSSHFILCLPDHVLDELEKYKEYVLKKSGLRKEEVDELYSILMENVWIISDEAIKSKIKEAMKIMEKIDVKDAPILAAALSFPNEGIWTEDKHFDQQNIVKVWKTMDLLKFL